MAKVKKVKEERLEDILFECRDNLRCKASIGDKRDLMLTLVFLKFMNDRYDEQVEKVLAEAKGNEKLAKILLSRPASFGKDGVIALPEECRWKKLTDETLQNKLAIALDTAIDTLEKQEKKLKNALPKGIFVSCDLDPKVIKSLLDSISKIDPKRFKEKDLIGRVYEYFLQAYATRRRTARGRGRA